MKSWSQPSFPRLAKAAPALRLRDEHTGELEVVPTNDPVGVYVCGITPYDTTHLGHAATYVTFDLAIRALRNAGHDVTYVQNVTDIDDPLLERAARDGIDWQDLAQREIDIFHADMEALRNLPPQHYIGVVETMPRHVEVISRLVAEGVAYGLPVEASEAGQDGAQDFYLDLSTQPSFGETSGWNREQMVEVFADRGETPTARASATCSTRCSGAVGARANPIGTASNSAPDAPAGTWNARRSRWTTSAWDSPCRAAAPTSSFPTTRCQRSRRKR